MRKKKLIAITMLGILMMTMMSACAGTADNADKDGASCMAVVMGCDWGPVVTKAVIAVPGALDKTQTISADMFDVSEKIKNGSFKSTDKREVTDAYFSDGTKKTSSSAMKSFRGAFHFVEFFVSAYHHHSQFFHIFSGSVRISIAAAEIIFFRDGVQADIVDGF